jgi:hypothetical protein
MESLPVNHYIVNIIIIDNFNYEYNKFYKFDQFNKLNEFDCVYDKFNEFDEFYCFDDQFVVVNLLVNEYNFDNVYGVGILTSNLQALAEPK